MPRPGPAYPDSGIGDGETNRCLAICFAQKLRLERHLAPFGELDGIAGEIGQHLAQAVGIAAQQRRNFRRHSRMELESLGARLDAQKLDHVRNRVAHVEAQIFKGDLSRLDLGKVQDVVDEGKQSPPAGLRHVGVLLVAPAVRSVSRSS